MKMALIIAVLLLSVTAVKSQNIGLLQVEQMQQDNDKAKELRAKQTNAMNTKKETNYDSYVNRDTMFKKHKLTFCPSNKGTYIWVGRKGKEYYWCVKNKSSNNIDDSWDKITKGLYDSLISHDNKIMNKLTLEKVKRKIEEMINSTK